LITARANHSLADLSRGAKPSSHCRHTPNALGSDIHCSANPTFSWILRDVPKPTRLCFWCGTFGSPRPKPKMAPRNPLPRRPTSLSPANGQNRALWRGGWRQEKHAFLGPGTGIPVPPFLGGRSMNQRTSKNFGRFGIPLICISLFASIDKLIVCSRGIGIPLAWEQG
jgi:hypothetical protein